MTSRIYLTVNKILARATGFVLHPALDPLSTFDCPIDLIIDIGVASGTPDVYALAPDANLILIEPLQKYWPDCERILKGRSGMLFKCAAGKDKAVSRLFEYGLSSSLLPRTDKDIGQRTTTVDVQPLDSLLRSCIYWEASENCLLKIDTEGYELECLKGSLTALRSKKIKYIFAECRIHGIDTYGFSELVCFLHSHHYNLLDLREVGYGRRRVNYLDCIFELQSP
ncbi:MAG: FkbM family methyltransferase [Deferrisomatales bacterium]|nr:FkbM family methyltransferase [Deferrisomatales bacterium]